MKKKNIMSKLWLIAIIIGFVTSITSCEEDYKLELPLAVNDTSLSFGAASGSTHVLVYCTGDWTATLKSASDSSWVTLGKSTGNGNGEFIFNYAANPGIKRKATVVLTGGGETKEIAMTQSGFLTMATMVFMKDSLDLPKWDAKVNLAFETNMGLALDCVKSKVEYIADDVAEATKADASTNWIKNITIYEDSVSLNVLANETGVERSANLTVYVKSTAENKTYSTVIKLKQQAQEGYITFVDTEVAEAGVTEVESFAKTVIIPWDTNLEALFDGLTVSTTYQESGDQWVTNPVFLSEGLQVDILESKYDGLRHANLTVNYNKDGKNVSATRQIVQARPALEVPFSTLRGYLTSEGSVVMSKDYILAQVISEPGNMNLETNPHTAWNQVDLTENNKTAYIQSVDGKYGLRVKFDSEDYAMSLPRYATVKIALAGLTLEREDNPTRYTLRGFTPEAILEIETGTAMALPLKNKHFSQITDDDIYTYVTLKDVEVAFNYGSWGNMHEGFALKSDVVTSGTANATRCDCVTKYFRDINGDIMPMVINAQVSWRRPGSRIPQGSGDINAIIVYSPLKRYNGNGDMGRYQFRVLDVSEIYLNSTTGFTNTIAEWAFQSGASSIIFDSTDTNTYKKRVLANIGTGVMNTSATLNTASTGTTTSFIETTFGAATAYKAFRYDAKWWNFTKNEGENISWTFSTAGITGNNRHLVMIMTASIGKQGQPNTGGCANWNVEYSTDGENFTVLKEDMLLFPSPIFAYTQGDIPAANSEYVINLPDSMLGKEEVTVRIKATSTKYLTSSGITAGTMTSSTSAATYVRFEAISFKYNK